MDLIGAYKWAVDAVDNSIEQLEYYISKTKEELQTPNAYKLENGKFAERREATLEVSERALEEMRKHKATFEYLLEEEEKKS